MQRPVVSGSGAYDGRYLPDLPSGRITLPAFTIANAAPQLFTFGQVLCVDRECSVRAWHLPSWAANHVFDLWLYLLRVTLSSITTILRHQNVIVKQCRKTILTQLRNCRHDCESVRHERSFVPTTLLLPHPLQLPLFAAGLLLSAIPKS